MTTTAAGAWVVYYHDYSSGVRIFNDELEAYKYAHSNSAQITFLPWGYSIKEAEAAEYNAKLTDNGGC